MGRSWAPRRHRRGRLPPRHRGILNLFHQPKVDVQKTWRLLIQVLLTAKTGRVPSALEIHDYQRDRLGRRCGETWFAELYPLPAKSEKDWIYGSYAVQPQLGFLSSRKTYRESCGPLKAVRVRTRLAGLPKNRRPRAVIFYGSHRGHFETIASIKLDSQMRSGAWCRQDNGTVFVMIRHPQAWKTPNTYWEQTGLELHSLIQSSARSRSDGLSSLGK